MMEKIPITIWGADVFDGTPGNPKLKMFLNESLREIVKQSLGVYRRANCIFVLSQHDWDKLLQSSEFEFLNLDNPYFGPARKGSIKHPDWLYGFEIKWIDFSWCLEEIAKQTNDFVFKDGE